jgi:hypothetical protein
LGAIVDDDVGADSRHLIGGADADLIVNGNLIDIKSGARATLLGKDVYQLIA